MSITSGIATAGVGDAPLKLSFNLNFNERSRGYVGKKAAFAAEGRRFESSV